MKDLPFVFGLDTDIIPIRLVVADSENSGHLAPYISEYRSFRSAESFKKYWLKFCRPTFKMFVAVPDSTPDPLGLVPWLRGRNVLVETFPLFEYREHLADDFAIWGMTKSFERPFALALYGCYKTKCGDVVSRLWTKLSLARGMLTEIGQDLHRLTAAFSEHDPPCEDDWDV
jgi:hypothetical protein